MTIYQAIAWRLHERQHANAVPLDLEQIAFVVEWRAAESQRLAQGVAPDENQSETELPNSVARSLPARQDEADSEPDLLSFTADFEPKNGDAATFSLGEPMPIDWLEWSVFVRDVG